MLADVLRPITTGFYQGLLLCHTAYHSPTTWKARREDFSQISLIFSTENIWEWYLPGTHMLHTDTSAKEAASLERMGPSDKEEGLGRSVAWRRQLWGW
jgi:hypothetical protein